MDRASPISDSAFASRLTSLASAGPLALAVSGGPDSMALAVLAARFARATGRRVTVLTVDHGLRAEAADEAVQVARWANALGLPHVTLRWDGPKPAADLQAAARDARYALMAEWCAAHRVRALAVAHTQDDQAETFLLRLGRGSGVDGLSAMAPSRDLGGLWLIRPLLDFSRDDVLATLAASGQPFVEDPSNEDARFARVRMRQLAPALAGEGLTPQRLSATARRMARARDALESWTADVARAAVTFDPRGFAVADPAALLATHEEIGLRLLSRLVMAVGGQDYPPRLERIERLYMALGGDGFSGATLGGAQFSLRGGRLFVLRETRGALEAPAVALEEGSGTVWDGRFELVAAERHAGLEVRALGARGWRAVRAAVPPEKAAIPAVAGAALPALFRQNELAGVPHLMPGGVKLRFLGPERAGFGFEASPYGK